MCQYKCKYCEFFLSLRYSIGNQEFPYFTRWCEEKFGITLNKKRSALEAKEDLPEPKNLPEPILLPELLEAVKELKIDYSIDDVDRLFRAHGHTLREIYLLRHSFFERIPDIVLWPSKLLLINHRHGKIIRKAMISFTIMIYKRPVNYKIIS
jgi:alkyldihydroxyacetonephosphate synthase